jgi:uncharacterized protein
MVATRSRTELEDLYLPFRSKRRTRAMIARERGLEPRADLLWAQDRIAGTREAVVVLFVSPEKEVPDVEAAWAGARDIVAERIAESVDARARLRALTLEQGVFRWRAAGEGSEPERLKFKDYFDFSGPAQTLPSHRVLAVRRGDNEEGSEYMARFAPVPPRVMPDKTVNPGPP